MFEKCFLLLKGCLKFFKSYQSKTNMKYVFILCGMKINWRLLSNISTIEKVKRDEYQEEEKKIFVRIGRFRIELC